MEWLFNEAWKGAAEQYDNSQLDRAPWNGTQENAMPLLKRRLRQVETNKTARTEGFAGVGVKELELDEAANTWSSHSA